MKRYRYVPLLTYSAILALSTVCTALAAPLVPSARDKCPVCGMFVAKFPDWTASVTFNDATVLFFDGAKDFFTYYHDIGKYTPARSRATIASVTVKDYYALRPVDARQAFYVMGSDVYGPMGKELVPFEKQADAQAFLKDHGGRKILRFGEITPALLKTLE
ncbi:nitrous oxide reductase accessory protein NosL [Geobacter sp. SVR]|uniref:nitrous oxide reductase accessory protein NosL n=1 Tax=Geobacter sp. SVR TaxID=2495594 RepID=UPI00143EFBBF|nr:nitrous oxide reductase accessory protein NosL [Geobacter sp. SVR]BCS55332.1 nitrous oxide reductase accessory protein NosL [Geobacter sp. SVR]GCF87257.1 nitrous oxide reductase accessory protein NosL [Geobacter sp. SVR]